MIYTRHAEGGSLFNGKFFGEKVMISFWNQEGSTIKKMNYNYL